MLSIQHHLGKRLLTIPSKIFVLIILTVATRTVALAEDKQIAAESNSTSDQLPDDFTKLDIRKLLSLDLVVTSPGRKEQKISDVSSAVYVISREDIKRSGATHIAQLLRSVPGVDVAEISANKWAVSIRGFNQVFAHRLLVLEDGVSVFSPTTNAVHWESQDVPLENIERIEVIRGPGAVLWGDNAVNGVINIITRKAADTQGARVEVGVGTQEKVVASLRYGGELSPDTHYRLSLRQVETGSNQLASKSSALDDMTSSSASFRLDSVLSPKDHLTYLADAQIEHENSLPSVPTVNPPYYDFRRFYDNDAEWRSAKTSLNWQHEFSEGSELQIKPSILYKERVANLISFDYQIYNLDVQHHYRVNSWMDLLYGGSARYFRNKSEGTYAQAVDPSVSTNSLYNTFIQDEITVVPHRVKFTLGTKFEHNDYSGSEWMPNARLVYTPHETLMFWGAISRARSTPAVYFETTKIPVAAFPIPGVPLTGIATLLGNTDLGSEDLIAHEVGARYQLTKEFYVDTAFFYNRYRDVFSQNAGTPFVGLYGDPATPALIVPLNFGNSLSVDSYGAEVSANYTANSWLSLKGSYSLIRLHADFNESMDVNDKNLIEGSSPRNQAGLTVRMKLDENVFFDNDVRYVDSLRFGAIPGYIDLDSRLAWEVTPHTELALIGTNLLHDSHVEFQGNLFGPPRTAIQRAGFLRLITKF